MGEFLSPDPGGDDEVTEGFHVLTEADVAPVEPINPIQAATEVAVDHLTVATVTPTDENGNPTGPVVIVNPYNLVVQPT